MSPCGTSVSSYGPLTSQGKWVVTIPRLALCHGEVIQ